MSKENIHRYDTVIVGGGIAGLTAAAYLTSYGFDVAVLEKQELLGGNIHSFEYKGHTFDGGIRSIESSGVLKPMIADLGLDVVLKRSKVTLGIQEDVIELSSKQDIEHYENLLISKFPENIKEIKKIVRKIKQILKYMDVLYGIDNPMMKDLKRNRSYVLKTLIPWLFRFFPTLYQIERLNTGVETYLKRFTQNQALIDLIAQHFFKSTPAFFALGYFSIYFDYHYPMGGTGKLIDSLETYILQHDGAICKNTQVVSIDVDQKIVKDAKGVCYGYRKLIWAADLKTLYQQIDFDTIQRPKTVAKIQKQKHLLEKKRGAESVLAVYATVDLPREYFQAIASGHFFYTASIEGESHNTVSLVDDQKALFNQLKEFYRTTTYEISIPSLRDETLSPKGQTGLIISVLMEYDLVKHLLNMGEYETFKAFTISEFIEILSNSIYKELKSHVMDAFCSTPLTFEKKTGSTDGAIIGWSYTNHPIPVVHRMSQITSSVHTPIPDVYQAGQWTFSPAGVPISILTGKLSADYVKKKLKKKILKIKKDE